MIIPLSSAPLLLLCYGLLAMSILALWIAPKTRTWQVLVLLSALVAFITDRIGILGLLIETGFGAVTYLFYRKNLSRLKKSICAFGIILLSIILSIHKVPGIQNWQIISHLKLSPDAHPTQLFLNLDKPLVGLFILGWSQSLISTRKEWILIFKQTLPFVLFSSLFLLFASYALNYVRFDMKWFEFSGTWLLANLLFTCVAEEAFFRGFLQTQLSRLLGMWNLTQPNNTMIAWILTSVLFGLAHFPGGISYVFLSIIAGLFYGYAYLSTQKIESSIMTHFSVNAIHFIAFTYPAIQH